MATRQNYRKLIEYRVNYINKKLGIKYHADYCSIYGGWNLYLIDKECGGQYRGPIGFDARKSSAEMLAYVDGIYELLNNYEIKKGE
jgi:hypothetical protein